MPEEDKKLEKIGSLREGNFLAIKKSIWVSFCCSLLSISVVFVVSLPIFFIPCGFFAPYSDNMYCYRDSYEQLRLLMGLLWFTQALLVFLIIKRKHLLTYFSFILIFIICLIIETISHFSYVEPPSGRTALYHAAYFIIPSVLFWIFYKFGREKIFIRMSLIFSVFLLIYSTGMVVYSRTSFNPGVCNLITKNETLRDDCFLKIAARTENADLCGKISGGWQQRCYKDIASVTKKINVCDKILDEWEKDDCYKRVAVYAKDESLCETILNIDRKEPCYAEVARQKKDSTICEKIIINLILRDNCKNQW